jgi:C-terminal processing protease CtpA/Prc
MFRFLDENDVERLIVDLRQNSGGEPKIASYLVEELGKRNEFTEQGRLFVLVGRRLAGKIPVPQDQ